MTECPDCENPKISEYLEKDSYFVIFICWNCGYYCSNSPTYEAEPKRFKDIVRDDPLYFMRKYGTYQPTGNRDKNNRQGNRTIF